MEERIVWEGEVAEIDAVDSEAWIGPDVVSIGEARISEMTRDDPAPFFVDLIVLREGEGTGKPRPKRYLARAVEDCVRLCPGTLGYLGHQKPADRDYEYRSPQMRIVKAKVDHVVDAKTKQRVKVCRAKGYVSRRSEDLRTHIREGMAGPVSIDGRALLEKREDELLVTELRALRSIDFCNPGTAGVAGAGVQAVVSEMGGGDENEPTRRSRTVTVERLTRAQLVDEYGADIREMKREAVDEAKAPLETRISEMESTIAEKDQKIAALEAEKAEAEKAKDAAAKEVAEMKTTLANLERREKVRVLETHRDELLGNAEIAGRKIEGEVREMVARRVGVDVLEEDDEALSKSKAAIEKSVADAVEEVAEIAKAFGGGTASGGSTSHKAGGLPPRTETGGDRASKARLVLARGKEIYGGGE